jgi:hypothetical protein
MGKIIPIRPEAPTRSCTECYHAAFGQLGIFCTVFMDWQVSWKAEDCGAYEPIDLGEENG